MERILSCVLLATKTINTVIVLLRTFILHSSNLKVIQVTFLSSILLTSDPCPLQIYAQKESQRSGYIELALQAYEQTAANSSAAWLANS